MLAIRRDGRLINEVSKGKSKVLEKIAPLESGPYR